MNICTVCHVHIKGAQRKKAEKNKKIQNKAHQESTYRVKSVFIIGSA